MKKKFLSLVLAVCLALPCVFLASCGKKETTYSVSIPKTTNAEAYTTSISGNGYTENDVYYATAGDTVTFVLCIKEGFKVDTDFKVLFNKAEVMPTATDMHTNTIEEYIADFTEERTVTYQATINQNSSFEINGNVLKAQVDITPALTPSKKVYLVAKQNDNITRTEINVDNPTITTDYNEEFYIDYEKEDNKDYTNASLSDSAYVSSEVLITENGEPFTSTYEEKTFVRFLVSAKKSVYLNTPNAYDKICDVKYAKSPYYSINICDETGNTSNTLPGLEMSGFYLTLGQAEGYVKLTFANYFANYLDDATLSVNSDAIDSISQHSCICPDQENDGYSKIFKLTNIKKDILKFTVSLSSSNKIKFEYANITLKKEQQELAIKHNNTTTVLNAPSYSATTSINSQTHTIESASFELNGVTYDVVEQNPNDSYSIFYKKGYGLIVKFTTDNSLTFASSDDASNPTFVYGDYQATQNNIILKLSCGSTTKTITTKTYNSNPVSGTTYHPELIFTIPESELSSFNTNDNIVMELTGFLPNTSTPTGDASFKFDFEKKFNGLLQGCSPYYDDEEGSYVYEPVSITSKQQNSNTTYNYNIISPFYVIIKTNGTVTDTDDDNKSKYITGLSFTKTSGTYDTEILTDQYGNFKVFTDASENKYFAIKISNIQTNSDNTFKIEPVLSENITAVVNENKYKFESNTDSLTLTNKSQNKFKLYNTSCEEITYDIYYTYQGNGASKYQKIPRVTESGDTYYSLTDVYNNITIYVDDTQKSNITVDSEKLENVNLFYKKLGDSDWTQVSKNDGFAASKYEYYDFKITFEEGFYFNETSTSQECLASLIGQTKTLLINGDDETESNGLLTIFASDAQITTFNGVALASAKKVFVTQPTGFDIIVNTNGTSLNKNYQYKQYVLTGTTVKIRTSAVIGYNVYIDNGTEKITYQEYIAKHAVSGSLVQFVLVEDIVVIIEKQRVSESNAVTIENVDALNNFIFETQNVLIDSSNCWKTYKSSTIVLLFSRSEFVGYDLSTVKINGISYTDSDPKYFIFTIAITDDIIESGKITLSFEGQINTYSINYSSSTDIKVWDEDSSAYVDPTDDNMKVQKDTKLKILSNSENISLTASNCKIVRAIDNEGFVICRTDGKFEFVIFDITENCSIN